MKNRLRLSFLTLSMFFMFTTVFSQLDPLPGDPLPGDPDPGIEVPLDGGIISGLLLTGITTVVILRKKKKNQ